MPTKTYWGTYLGIDFGTSGARAVAIAPSHEIQAHASVRYEGFKPEAQPETERSWPEIWQAALFELLSRLPVEIRRTVQAIAINGTSSTVLLCDPTGQPLEDALLYHDARGAAMLETLQAIAPADHVVLSATSSLAKLLWWSHHKRLESPASLLHQADWLAFLLHGKMGISDYHNALKLGYDVGELRYPDWMEPIPTQIQLPAVVAPGTPIGSVTEAIATRFELPQHCQVCAGTTDSIAAFLASGASSPGEAVTSLGSTLVLKLLSETRVDDSRHGIYSHRLGDLWLVGGASNTGGAVLQQFFSTAELQDLSQKIQPERESLLHYYPLLQPGERFPRNDPNLQPQLEPRPDNSVDFLHGLLESMARIEAQGYRLLQELGATPLQRVYTAGGGAQNHVWTKMRSRHLQVPVQPSAQTEAAYGTALLAQTNLES